MSFIFSLIIWAVIILAIVYFAQIIVGLAIWFAIGVVWLVTFPVIWGYKKLKKEEA